MYQKNYSWVVLLSFSLLASSTRLYAQKKLEEAKFKFYYTYAWQYDTLKNNDYREDLIILQIGLNVSKNFSYYTFQSDSLLATSDGGEVLEKSIRKALIEWKAKGIMPRPAYSRRMSTIVYKNHPENQITVTDNINSDYYQYTEPLHAQTWQIIDSTKTILDYTCQMAVCDFRGRQWIAWFAHDIPISDGPWKFSGLPGLIMEVYDVRKHYHYTLVGMEQVEDEPIVFSPVVLSFGSYGKHEKTTRLEFLRGLARYQGNMGSIMNAELGQDTFDEGLFNARPYDLLERDYR